MTKQVMAVAQSEMRDLRSQGSLQDQLKAHILVGRNLCKCYQMIDIDNLKKAEVDCHIFQLVMN